MTSAITGKTVADATGLFESFHGMVSGRADATKDLGKLGAFSGVREFQTRVKCATLCWHTLKAALTRKADAATTE